MRKIYRSVLVGAALVVTAPQMATAGDLGFPAYGGMKDGPVEVAPVAVAGHARFYLRGDTGYSLGSSPEGFEVSAADNPLRFNDALVDEDLSGAWTIGGGVGMYFTSALRGDLTIDHRFDADLEGHNPFAQGQDNKTELSSTVFLANFYYDITDRSSAIVPYVGFGLGFSRNKTGKRDLISSCDTGDYGVYGATVCGSSSSTGGATKTSFAGAAMVGFTANISGDFKLDAGYRYLFMGDAETGRIAPAFGGPLEFDDLSAHEFRIGVRYDLYR